MSKLAGMITVLCGFIILFNLFVPSYTNTGSLVSLLFHPQNFTSNNVYIELVAILNGVALIGLASLYFSGSFKLDFILTASIALIFLNSLNELVNIFNTIYSASSILAIIILGPFVITWIIAVIEWWRGVG